MNKVNILTPGTHGLNKYNKYLLFAAMIIFTWLLYSKIFANNTQFYFVLILAIVCIIILFKAPYIMLGFLFCSFATLNELLLARSVNIPGLGQLYNLDFLFFTCISVFVIHILLQKRNIQQTPLDSYIVILLIVSVFALVRGYMILGSFDAPISRFRVMTYWSVFFLYVWAITNLKQLRIIYTAFILTVTTASILSLVHFAQGEVAYATMTAVGEQIGRLPGPVSAKILPVALLILIATISSIRNRFDFIIYRIAIPLVFIAFILKLTRGHWIGFTVGLIYLLSFKDFKYRKRILGFAVILTIIVLSLFYMDRQVGPTGSLLEYVSIRARGIFDPEHDVNTFIRVQSFVIGTKVLFIRPLMGFGFGGYGYRAIQALGLMRGMYNSYILWGIETGIVGLVFLIVFLAVVIKRGRYVIKYTQDKFWKNFLIGTQCSLIAILITAFTQYTFQVPRYVFILTFLIACPEIIHRLSRRIQDKGERNKVMSYVVQ